jgi:hypothetical protein
MMVVSALRPRTFTRSIVRMRLRPSRGMFSKQASVIRIWPGRANSTTRAATLTASPNTSPRSSGPKCMPIRRLSLRPLGPSTAAACCCMAVAPASAEITSAKVHSSSSPIDFTTAPLWK